ncbi:cupin domain-containing protein [Couchioplanes caeruleus]|nr:cupin domain-containing protein [Couchioplanes caeruleus]
MSAEYDMKLQSLLPSSDIPGIPFGSVFGSVPPGETSKRHTHQDGEVFIVLRGRAFVGLGDEEHEITVGDVCYLTPFRMHWIRNEADEPFDLVSLYREDPGTVVAELANQAPGRCWPSVPLSSARR